jgi:enamine deaminase RidA (YjgF/YER057c/UK114 family)
VSVVLSGTVYASGKMTMATGSVHDNTVEHSGRFETVCANAGEYGLVLGVIELLSFDAYFSSRMFSKGNVPLFFTFFSYLARTFTPKAPFYRADSAPG